LAALHDLTAYDAAYLELAMRRGCTLVTSDKALSRAAKRAGVTTLSD
jgi:predicted nucleic acid-binding protein